MCVLSILQKGKSYGYEIMKELERFNLELKGEGSIYPILTKLKDKQLVHVTRELTDQGRARVYYEINEAGQQYLQRKIEEWMTVQRDIQTLLNEFGHQMEGRS
ncbi:PadR family transcriptional regulator [Bacillus horti]